MFSVEMIKLFSITANTAIVFASITAAVWSIKRLIYDALYSEDDQHKLTHSAKGLIWGLLMWSVGETLRIGWWIPAMLFADTVNMYATFFDQYRWLMYLPAALLIISGVSKTIKELDGTGLTGTMPLVFGAFLVGLAVSITHHFVVYM